MYPFTLIKQSYKIGSLKVQILLIPFWRLRGWKPPVMAPAGNNAKVPHIHHPGIPQNNHHQYQYRLISYFGKILQNISNRNLPSRI